MNVTVLVDSWAWIAMLDDRDLNHRAALRQYAALRQADTPLVTTNLIVYEAYEHLRREHGLPRALKYIEQVGAAASVLRIAYISREDEGEALEFAVKYHDQDFSLVDCVSFVLMRRRGLQTAFTGDKHFITAGFNIIPDIPR
ncbi:MAG: PIN domain-containing protein [Armatimonadetes bacterium]|nr:PIN domain-containing protein [Armatimonadota bacterium]